MFNQQQMQELVRRVHQLDAESPATGRERDHQKWAMGDVIAEMKALVEAAQAEALRPAWPVTFDAKEVARFYAQQYKEVFTGLSILRDTAVDYAALAKMFPPNDRMRTCGLTFSHARAISRVKPAAKQIEWMDRAIGGGWSVAWLQKEINAAQPSVRVQPEVPDAATTVNLATPVSTAHLPQASKQRISQHTFYCSQTDRPLTDLKSMIEIRVHPESPLIHPESPLNANISKPRRGGAAKRDRTERLPESSRVFRFENPAALMAWIAARGVPLENVGEATGQADAGTGSSNADSSGGQSE